MLVKNRKDSLLRALLIAKGGYLNLKKIGITPFTHWLETCNQRRLSAYWKKDDLKMMISEIKKNLTTASYSNFYKNEYEKKAAGLETFSKHIYRSPNAWKKETNKNLTRILKGFVKTYSAFTPFMLTPHIFEVILTNQLFRIPHKGQKIRRNISKLAIPLDTTFEDKFQKEITILSLRIQQNKRLVHFLENQYPVNPQKIKRLFPKVWQIIIKFQQNWLFYPMDNYEHQPLTTKEVVDLIQEQLVANRDLSQRLDRLAKNHQKILDQCKKMENELQLKKENKTLLKFLQYNVWLRTARLEIFRKAHLTSQPLFTEILQRMGLADKYLSFITHEEFEKFLTEGSVPNKQELDRRLDKCIFTLIKGQLQIETRLAQLKKWSLFFQINLPTVTFIKGQVASRGKAVGKVRIIHNKSELNKFKRGDVLVANMTNPDYVLIMQKASAIVTDEGGVTCHAAIVSRELEVPCIVGTQIATEVFKDGDLVEVDAERGIVEKIH